MTPPDPTREPTTTSERVAVVLFTRDLRVHDQPALAAACRAADHVVPLFVHDPQIDRIGFATPNRTAFLCDALADLRASLRGLGGDLVVRHGDPVDQAITLAHQTGAGRIYVAADVTAHAQRRERRLRDAGATHAIEVTTTPGVTVVPTGRLTATGGGHYKVFTPYWRAWSGTPWRAIVDPPTRVRLPEGIEPGDVPTGDRAGCSPGLPTGGETVGRHVLRAWTRSHLADYEQHHDALAADRTSRISPYLHFGCLSPLEVATRLARRPGGAAFVRQLAWRDFHHETIAHFPALPTRELRPRGRQWHHDPDVLAAWQEGRTGVPIVDAGMRQLLDEGWMHNRARLITASYLTKTMGIDWRHGAVHFLRWLVDGDVANNSANWQWVAGTGTDTRPNRTLNPHRQAARHDPDGDYVARYLSDPADGSV